MAILWIVNVSTAQEPIIALTKGVEKTFAAEGIGTGFVSIYIYTYIYCTCFYRDMYY